MSDERVKIFKQSWKISDTFCGKIKQNLHINLIQKTICYKGKTLESVSFKYFNFTSLNSTDVRI